jgi:subtilisin family serine protease
MVGKVKGACKAACLLVSLSCVLELSTTALTLPTQNGVADSTKHSYQVSIHPATNGTDALAALWKDHELWLGESRSVYNKRGTYLVFMTQAQASELAGDQRVASVRKRASGTGVAVNSRSGSDITNDVEGILADADPRILKYCRQRAAAAAPLLEAISNPLSTTAAENMVRTFVNQSHVECKPASVLHNPTKVSFQVLADEFYDASAAPAETVADRIRAAASLTAPCPIPLNVSTATGERLFIVDMFEVNMCEAVYLLRATEGVARVEYAEVMRHLNNYAAATGQSGVHGKVSRESAVIWAQGLMGQNEVVGVGDSGVDIDSCYFRETKTSAPKLKGCDMSRKKIVCYIEGPFAEFGDDGINVGGGHGTHVAGTIAGLHTRALRSDADWNVAYEDLLKSADYPNGIAPLARLAILDINGQDVRSVLPPNDLSSSSFFISPYEDAGVRVHSNSWGCSRGDGRERQCNKYDAQTRSVDEFMWRNKDFLVIIAAGNSGLAANADRVDGTGGIMDAGATFGPGTVFGDGFYTVGSPATMKNGISVGATRRNRAPLTCMFQSKECGTDDLYAASSRGPTFDGRTKPDIVFPGEQLLSAQSSGNPGDFSDGVCDAASGMTGTRYQSGTSMACPGVAGLAALVRQYYREFDPSTGARTSPMTGSLADGRGPSAALVKATIINSARPLTGYYEYIESETEEKAFGRVQEYHTPRHLEGFGLPGLNNTLSFSNVADSPSLHVFDRLSLAKDGESHTFQFQLQAGSSLKVTLVYTDAPGPVVGAFDSTPVLINDLDLSASCQPGPCSTVSSTDDSAWTSASRVDNVEQLPFPFSTLARFSTNTTIFITVSAHNIDQGPQPYSLVASGANVALTQAAQPNWTPDWAVRALRPRLLQDSLNSKLIFGALIACGVLIVIFAGSAIVKRCGRGPSDDNDSLDC